MTLLEELDADAIEFKRGMPNELSTYQSYGSRMEERNRLIEFRQSRKAQRIDWDQFYDMYAVQSDAIPQPNWEFVPVYHAAIKYRSITMLRAAEAGRPYSRSEDPVVCRGVAEGGPAGASAKGGPIDLTED